MKKGVRWMKPDALGRYVGRCERIRTFDPLHPMQVRYQAAPHTEALNYNLRNSVNRTKKLPDLEEFAAKLADQRLPGLLQGCAGVLLLVLQSGVELLAIDLDGLDA